MEAKTTMELLAELSELVVAHEAISNEGAKASDLEQSKSKIDAALAAYNKAATDDAFAAWNTAEFPLIEAIKARVIPGLKRVSFRKDTKSGRIVGKIDGAEVKVDLYDAFIRHSEWFKGRAWWHALEKLAFVMANAIAEELCKNPIFAYEIEKASEEFAFAEDADPRSKRSRVKALQCVVDAILPDTLPEGMEKVQVNKYDLAYVDRLLAKQGKKAGAVVICGTDKMSELVTDVLYMHICNKEYELLSK